MKVVRLGVGAVLGAAVLCCAALPVWAQAPGDPGMMCLCLKQSVDATGADMQARQGQLGAAQGQLNQLDAQLASARPQVNVNDPQSVAQFRQLLAQRDAAFRQVNGGLMTAAQAATAQYNQAVANYNSQCAGRPLPPPPPGPLVCR
jgi:hypothetical protein